MIPYLKGFHLTIEMWRGGRNAEGWKIKGDDASILTSKSIESVDVTRSGAHGANLDMKSSYTPLKCEDEDEACMDHRLDKEFLKGRLYAPVTGITISRC